MYNITVKLLCTKCGVKRYTFGQSYTMIANNQVAVDKVLKVKNVQGGGATAVGQLEFGEHTKHINRLG